MGQLLEINTIRLSLRNKINETTVDKLWIETGDASLFQWFVPYFTDVNASLYIFPLNSVELS